MTEEQNSGITSQQYWRQREDLSGHVESGKEPNGPQHTAQSNIINGEKLIGACTAHNLTPREHVESPRGRADGMEWGVGGVKPGNEIFDHIVHRYKLAVNKSSQSESTRWHYAKLKHTMDNPEAELHFEE